MRPGASPPVTLVAISKTFAAGRDRAGDRRRAPRSARTACRRRRPSGRRCRERHPGLELHLVGPLQSNKAKEAVALFDAIHSVDRPSLCRGAGQGDRPAGPAADCCSSRSIPAPSRRRPGVLPEEADAFLAACRESYGLAIAGLMCIPPVDEPPAPHFALTAKIARRNGLAAPVHGHERRFRDRDRFRRHPRAGGHGDFRGRAERPIYYGLRRRHVSERPNVRGEPEFLIALSTNGPYRGVVGVPALRRPWVSASHRIDRVLGCFD